MLFNSDLPYSEKRHTEHLKNVIVKEIDILQKHIDTLQSKLDEKTGKIIPIKTELLKVYNGPLKSEFKRYINNYDSYWFSEKKEYKRIVAIARETMNKSYEECEKFHKENIPGIEQNKQLIKQIKNLMTNLGIPETYNTYEFVRNKRKTIMHEAGYLGDLGRNIPIYDGFESVIIAHKENLSRLASYEKKFEDEIAKEEQEKNKKESDAKKLTELVKLAAKHNVEVTELDVKTIADDILEVVCSKDKYLRLGDALLRNRNEYSDGCDIVQNALSSFVIKTDKDKLIYNSINELVANWDGDGRVFRDCPYNFNVLIQMANSELSIDYHYLQNIIC